MATPIAMPKLGITMEEGTIVEWPRAIGDHVEKGEVVLVIESEKAEVEIEASASGYVRHLYAEVGDTLECGAILGAITESAEEDFDPTAFAAEASKASEEKPRRARPAVSRPTAVPRPAGMAARDGRPRPTPAARVKARALGVELERVGGTGPGGRVTRRDVEEWAERRSRLVTVADGVGLDVLRSGAGAPVVLLPGFGTDVSVFARQIPAWSEGFEVLAVNPRGVAGSDAPDGEIYPIAQAASDAAGIASGPAHVVGASLGAAVALELALAHPERVRSLTLITPFVESGGRLDAVAQSWSRLAGAVPSDELARTLLPWFFSVAALAEEADRERLVRGLGKTLAQVPAATLARVQAGMQDWSGSRLADLATLAVPTLVVIAGADLLTPDGETISAAIPGAKTLVVPGAGHAVTIEAPEEVAEAVRAHVVAHAGE